MPGPRVSEPPPPRPDVARDDGTAATPFTTWRRLHPAAIAVWISGIIGGFAIPLLVLLVFGGERGPLFFSAAFGAIAVVGSAIRWTRYWYRLDGRTLVIRGGLLQRWERTIQPARIQSVDVVQKLTHRLFGVVELRIEVVGGTGTEGSLVALTPEEATRLRALLMADHVADDDPTEPALVRMRAADLLLAGATGGRVAVVAAMAGWAFQVLPEGTFVETLDRLAGARRSDFETILVIVGVLLTASILISLVSTILVYWDFTAVRRDDRLVITRGLLQTRRSVVPIARIQAIRLEENLVRRAFGLASLRVLTAGYGRGSGDEQQSSMLVPVADRRDASSSRRRSSARPVSGTPRSFLLRREPSCVDCASARSSASGPSRSCGPSGTVRSRRRFPFSRSRSGSSSWPGGLSAMRSSDRTSWPAREPSCGARPSRTRRTSSISSCAGHRRSGPSGSRASRSRSRKPRQP